MFYTPSLSRCDTRSIFIVGEAVEFDDVAFDESGIGIVDEVAVVEFEVFS